MGAGTVIAAPSAPDPCFPKNTCEKRSPARREKLGNLRCKVTEIRDRAARIEPHIDGESTECKLRTCLAVELCDHPVGPCQAIPDIFILFPSL